MIEVFEKDNYFINLSKKKKSKENHVSIIINIEISPLLVFNDDNF